MIFEELVKNKRVAVVGNAQSLFSKSYGKLIDQHDIIIRFNKPATLYSENCIFSHGTKMDVWAFWSVGAFYNKVLMKENNMEKMQNVFFNDTSIIKIQASEQNYKDYTENYINDTYPHYKLKRLSKKLCECFRYQHINQRREQSVLLRQNNISFDKIEPSIGVVVLAWLLETGVKEVNIFGMDFKLTPTFSEIDKYKKDMLGRIDKRCNHNFALEELFVKNIIIKDQRFRLRV